MKRIDAAFDVARREGRAAFIPYLTGGFPDATGFLEHARTLLRFADILEVGLPYSDPLGDGPTIQRSSERALAQGATTAGVLGQIATLRAESDKPIVLMTYYNPIYRHPEGEAGFLAALKGAGADGLILPDLPPDEGPTLIEAARALDLATIFLVAPTSTEARLRLVTAACRGFVYAVSVTGVTGARNSVGAEVPELVARVGAVTELPTAVGFGVSNGATAAQVAAVADGVVVGSALVRAIESGDDLEALAAELRAACVRTEGATAPG
jgi:tryptophan synthase alpha chain